MTSTAGVGLVAAAGLAALFAPEGAPVEITGAEEGFGLITTGDAAAALGNSLTAFANTGSVKAGIEAGATSVATNQIRDLALGGLFHGASEASVSALSAMMGQVADAVHKEEVACGVE